MGFLLNHGSPWITKYDPFFSAFFVFCFSFVAITFIRTFIEPVINDGFDEVKGRAICLIIIALFSTLAVHTYVKPGLDWLPWNWKWVLAYCIVTVILLNAIIDPHMYWLRWSTWWVGDSIAITGGVYFATKILTGYVPNMFFDRWIYTGIFMLVGFALAITLWMTGMSSRGTTWSNFFELSELYHNVVVWPVFTAIVGHMLLAALFNRPNPWSQNDAYLWSFVALFLVTVGKDSFFVDWKKPGR